MYPNNKTSKPLYQINVCYDNDFEHYIVLGQSITPFDEIIVMATQEVCNASKQNIQAQMYIDANSKFVKVYHTNINTVTIYFVTKIY